MEPLLKEGLGEKLWRERTQDSGTRIKHYPIFVNAFRETIDVDVAVVEITHSFQLPPHPSVRIRGTGKG